MTTVVLTPAPSMRTRAVWLSQTIAMSKRSALAIVRQPALVVPSLIFPLFFAALGTSSFGGTPRALSYLAQKFLAVPVLAERVRSEFDRITREPVWNQQVLMDRLDLAGRVLATADTTGRTASDVERFVSLRPAIERIIRSSGPAIR